MASSTSKLYSNNGRHSEYDLECFFTANFDIRTLARELKSVNSKWFVLGIHLGVQYSDLQKIKQTYLAASVEDLLIHVLYSWLRSNPSSSWSNVITALRDLNETILADELESSYTTESNSYTFCVLMYIIMCLLLL